MRKFKWLYKSLGLDRMWFVHNTRLSYEAIRDLDAKKQLNYKTNTLEEIYRATKVALGKGFLPGDYLNGEMWEHCRSDYHYKAMAYRELKLSGQPDPDEKEDLEISSENLDNAKAEMKLQDDKIK